MECGPQSGWNGAHNRDIDLLAVLQMGFGQQAGKKPPESFPVLVGRVEAQDFGYPFNDNP